MKAIKIVGDFTIELTLTSEEATILLFLAERESTVYNGLENPPERFRSTLRALKLTLISALHSVGVKEKDLPV